eukprot:CAMPEP_0174253678 /NCGR_PEP_ID=MMETSP0439-20130205/3047_1 /TAXON_ID=0 /ORGANISM="Stereomyxa ramosa, Strain Chinc5" /LENGTH=611 /DNA_ID=CAMNT_0015334839 /DNA_START=973 /DNA_END=2808 /DNA_ORIENTATION=+
MSLKNKQVIRGLRLESKQGAKNIILEPKHNFLVMSGDDTSLQFYDLQADKHISSLEVSPPLAVKTFNGRNLEGSVIDFVSFSKNGDYLVTLENRRNTGQFSDECVLKFWNYNFKQQKYVLNTRVDNPHGKSAVTAVVFNPQINVVVTCSFDGTFKLWRHVVSSDDSGMHVSPVSDTRAWMCKSTNQYRDSSCLAASFSSDGSVLAVSYSQVITLWDVNSTELTQTLGPLLAKKDKIKGLSFVPNSPYLVAYSKKKLFVWNLLTCSVWWSYSVAVRTLTVEQPSSPFSRFLITTEKFLILFDAASPQPLCVWKPSFDLFLVLSTTFLNPHHSLARIVCLNNRHELYHLTISNTHTTNRNQRNAPLFVPYDQPMKKESQKNKTSNNKNEEEEQEKTEPMSNFEALYGKVATDNKTKNDNEDTARTEMVVEERETTAPLFDGPSHVIPSTGKLFGSFMDSLLIKAPQPLTDTPSSDLNSLALPDPSPSTPSLSADKMEEAASMALEKELRNGYFIFDKQSYGDMLSFFKEEFSEPQTTTTPKNNTKSSKTKRSPKQKTKRKSMNVQQQENNANTPNKNNGNVDHKHSKKITKKSPKANRKKKRRRSSRSSNGTI